MKSKDRTKEVINSNSPAKTENLETKIKTTLNLTYVKCCVCESEESIPVGIGEDYEYNCCPDSFVAVRCRSCGLVYLNPRPSLSEFNKIYPPTYHAFDFSEKKYGIVYNVRSRLEARRFLKRCQSLPDDARILDIGCGDGFHLGLFRKYGKKSWKLEGVDIDKRAVEAASNLGHKVYLGSVEEINLPENAYDLVFMIQTMEHVERPDGVLRAIHRLLRKGGRVVIVTDNTGSLDFQFFKGSCWGGYHFPRHWNLFDRRSISILARNTGFEIENLGTIVSPVNWVYSIHNLLVRGKKPKWMINSFTLSSAVSLSLFTALDFGLQKIGKGALLEATFRKPL